MHTFFVVSLWEYLGQDYSGPGDSLCHVFRMCHAHQLLCLRRSCQLLYFIRYCQRNQLQVNIINRAHSIIQCQIEGASIKLVYYRGYSVTLNMEFISWLRQGFWYFHIQCQINYWIFCLLHFLWFLNIFLSNRIIDTACHT